MGKSPKRSNFDFFFTDYENIEINYECEEFMWGWMKNERIAIAGRQKYVDEEVMDLARAVISEQIPEYYNYIFDEGT